MTESFIRSILTLLKTRTAVIKIPPRACWLFALSTAIETTVLGSSKGTTLAYCLKPTKAAAITGIFKSGFAIFIHLMTFNQFRIRIFMGHLAEEIVMGTP